MDEVWRVVAGLGGTLALRPYVAAFLAVFIVLAGRDQGIPRTLGFLGWGTLVAFTAEFASTRTGIPFGLYHYTGTTAGRELFIAGVPIFDPLSFPFLAYASWCLARWIGDSDRGARPVLLTGLLMMLLDVVIDPLAVRGNQWFLGHVFWYPEGGPYFGVPLSNFAGWLLVGMAGVAGYLLLAPSVPRVARTQRPWPGVGLYYGVLFFNLSLTAWIGEWLLLTSGVTVHIVLALALLTFMYPRAGFARPILAGKRRGGARVARDDRRKGGEAPLRG